MVRGQRPSELEAILRDFPSRDHVCFTTGEPTLNPLLPWLLRTARDEGYREVALVTNGRRLADRSYLARLLDAGLDLVTVSIHGHGPSSHDRLTRAPGSFAQTARGLRAARGRVRLHTATVLCARNLESLLPLLALLGRLGVEQSVLNVVKPRGRADRAAATLLPSHGEVVEAVAGALRSLGPAAPPTFLEDVPPCAMERLPPSVRGVLEHNVRFDRRAPEQGEAGYEELDRARTEAGLRSKRPDCASCRHDPDCPGPWTRYVEVHGWHGLDPVR